MCVFWFCLGKIDRYLSGRVNLGVIIGMFGDYRGPLRLEKK